MVHRIRIIVSWGLYWGPLCSEPRVMSNWYEDSAGDIWRISPCLRYGVCVGVCARIQVHRTCRIAVSLRSFQVWAFYEHSPSVPSTHPYPPQVPWHPKTCPTTTSVLSKGASMSCQILSIKRSTTKEVSSQGLPLARALLTRGQQGIRQDNPHITPIQSLNNIFPYSLLTPSMSYGL